MAIEDTDPSGHPLSGASAAASGLHPYTAADLQAAYRLPSVTTSEHQTIALVDAYDDPNATADLTVYRKANHLPPCTVATGCLRKVNQQGQQGSYPRPDQGWALEESLDLDMASAVCPHCAILLVEARNNALRNLGAAADTAVRLGANVISNSYEAPEAQGYTVFARHYDHPGVVITAASGDSGFGVAAVPAAYATVVAVGGTTLYRSTSKRGWSETAWTGSGSGCSAYVAKPSWQHDPLCGMRTVADVAAVADPATPVNVYDSYNYTGWDDVGGTSVASPLVAGVFALAHNASSITPGPYLYAHHGDLFDVTAGSNGFCGGGYLCRAGKGYDGPTGWGTPDGVGAF
ncbi:MAG TPA: S8 family serine peptidase [Streptosporangiaceae bacterium]|nr:S8 family serine peptidase [Streptosporangiaceae bacterium]